jgi:hypothetical protein
MSAGRWEIERALRSSGLPYPARLLVLSLLTRADADTATVPLVHSPSLKRLAADTGLDRRTVVRHLAIAEKAGWITPHRSPRAAEELTPNWYQVHLPPGGTVPLGAERPQGPRGRPPPDLGAESHKPRGTVPPNQTTRPKPDRPSARERAARPPKAAPEPKPDPAADPDTRDILAAFIDWVRGGGGDLTRRTIGQCAREIKELLGEGVADTVIRQALALRHQNGRGGALHKYVDQVRNGAPPPAPSRRQSERDAMFDRAMARAEALDAAEARGELPS